MSDNKLMSPPGKAVGVLKPPVLYDTSLCAEKKLEASLVASSFAENQFLLIGTGPSSPIAACDPDQDPVIMAVSFSKSQTGPRIVTALLPGELICKACSKALASLMILRAHLMAEPALA